MAGARRPGQGFAPAWHLQYSDELLTVWLRGRLAPAPSRRETGRVRRAARYPHRLHAGEPDRPMRPCRPSIRRSVDQRSVEVEVSVIVARAVIRNRPPRSRHPRCASLVQLVRPGQAVVVLVLPQPSEPKTDRPVAHRRRFRRIDQGEKAVAPLTGCGSNCGVVFPNISDISLMAPSPFRSSTSQASSLPGWVQARAVCS